jgi:hypothetical protein
MKYQPGGQPRQFLAPRNGFQLARTLALVDELGRGNLEKIVKLVRRCAIFFGAKIRRNLLLHFHRVE